ncbi:hypothetical protein [Roseibium marinum]|uniref:hypothetical protein n=1 Tax=Roseibium marinum TaxID=281252 RepID=UPI001475A0C1|nr:hypothetical protein [Roseibium marinum]
MSAKVEKFKQTKKLIRPVVENWYLETKKSDKSFKKIRQNEISKVVRRAARLYLASESR